MSDFVQERSGVTKFIEGMLVENTGAPQWGPGKIVHVSGGNLHIIFRELEQEMARVFRADAPALRMAAVQSDSILDNLPPLIEKDGHWLLPAKRLPLEWLKRKFSHEFPAGFSDPAYLEAERDYKLFAHVLFQKELGLENIRSLVASGNSSNLAAKALKVLSSINLLSPYESAAFHDAMQDKGAVISLFSALLKTLDANGLDRDAFEEFFDAVTSLPADRGRVATWPVASVFPYISDPDRFMFLKPEVTKTAADSLGFDLKYNATPNWPTFEALHRMGAVYLNLLRPLGARDFVDVQSFIWVCCGGYDDARAKAAAKQK
jgi:hypothetical protein